MDVLDAAKRAVALAQHGGEPVAARHRGHGLAAHVGLGGKAIGDHPAVADPGDHRLHFGMIDAQHRRAVERHVLDEFDKGLLHRVEAAVVIEVFGIDVGDDRDRAVEPQERAVALVGLDHHPFAGAEPGVGTVAVDDAAVDHRGIDPAGIEQRGDHAGGGGLAVGAGDRDRALQPHQFGEHFGAAHDGNAGFERGGDFGVVALDRGRGHHHRRLAEILRGMADHYLDPALAQALDDIALGNVGALHAVAEVVHHFGNARHADAADADEMDRADVGGDAFHWVAPKLRMCFDKLSMSECCN